MGKRSGDGFVAHKAILVNALSRGLADRLMLMDFTIGRKGLLGYLKAMAGSNVVKLVPANGSASETQAAAKMNNHNFAYRGYIRLARSRRLLLSPRCSASGEFVAFPQR